MREKLKYAIHFCKSIDTDDYARVALADTGAMEQDSSNESEAEAIVEDVESVDSDDVHVDCTSVYSG